MLFGKNIDVESYLLFLISVFVQAHALRRYWSLCAFAPAQSPVRSPFTRRERMEPRGFLPEATKISDGYILNQD